jgi:hypothetical protein
VNSIDTVGKAADHFETVLQKAGHTQFGYYAAPGGFVLVTRLERFLPSGEPVAGSARWSTEVSFVDRFSIADYLISLLHQPVGYYRVFALL